MQAQTRIVQIFAVTFVVVILLLGLSIQSAFATSSPNSYVLIATPWQGSCEANGGSWNGSTPFIGTCTYGPDHALSEANCPAGASYEETFNGSATAISSRCVGSGRGFGGSGDSSADEDNSQPVTLHLHGGKNGYVSFGAGACDPQCTISPNLPYAAKAALPSGALATLYVRVPDGNTGLYTVCFNNLDNKQLLIYRFVSGAWVAVTFGSGANPLCTSASGDGAFFLGPNSPGADGSYQDQINITIDF